MESWGKPRQRCRSPVSFHWPMDVCVVIENPTVELPSGNRGPRPEPQYRESQPHTLYEKYCHATGPSSQASPETGSLVAQTCCQQGVLSGSRDASCGPRCASLEAVSCLWEMPNVVWVPVSKDSISHTWPRWNFNFSSRVREAVQ